MLTGTALMNELIDELNELKLLTMAATLDDLYATDLILHSDQGWQYQHKQYQMGQSGSFTRTRVGNTSTSNTGVCSKEKESGKV